METNNKQQKKEFDTVETFREIKENISTELVGKSAAQIKEYLKTKSLKIQAQ